MKKNYLLFALALFFSLHLNAQEVPEVQKSLITKVTATWCPPCGSWGWDLFEGLVEDNSQKALVIANHYSGDLENATADAIALNFNIFSQPRFILNNVDQAAASNTVDTKRAEIKSQVEDNYLLSPLVNAGLEATLDGDLLTVNTKTHFFQSAMGEYYVGVYIIEDGVVNFQQSQGDDAIHKNVLRTGMSTDHFGELIMNGDIAMGMEFNHQFSMTLDASWNVDNLEVATIIWEKEGDTYVFVNTNSTTTFAAPTLVTEISSDQLTMTVQPTISAGNATLVLDVVQPQSDLQIAIFNQLGQLQANVFSGNANAGVHTFDLERGLDAGVYNVVARLGERVLSTRFIVR